MTDRELIVALAERVLGFCIITAKQYHHMRGVPSAETFVEQGGELYHRDINDQFTVRWNPLESWNDAGVVVEAMRKDGYDFALEADEATVPWFAMFGEDLSHGVMADSAPRAICMAALAAVEAK